MASRRKASKLVSYKVGCMVALGVSEVFVRWAGWGVRLKRRVKGGPKEFRGLV